ncbi:MAG: sel1 repeat family protein, partial [Zoogloeaceae bacterium]|nr:sel1 repeat family protein [Zoogloeaceae bacterium]
KDRARKWLARAAEHGHADAQYRLAMSLAPSEGKPDEDDYPVIVENLEKAADAGHVPAMFRLGEIYHFPEQWGRQNDYAKAEKYYRLAERDGHLKAKRNLAVLYLEGKDAKKKSQLALKMLEECAENGDSVCYLQLAYVYNNKYKNAHIAESKEKTIYNIAVSVLLKNPDALYILGEYYIIGNRNLGIELFRQSAALGHNLASEKLKELGVKK